MKVKSLYNVMPKNTTVFITREVVSHGAVVDVDILYYDTFENMTNEELQIWTEDVSIDTEEKCLLIKAKENVIDAEPQNTKEVP